MPDAGAHSVGFLSVCPHGHGSLLPSPILSLGDSTGTGNLATTLLPEVYPPLADSAFPMSNSGGLGNMSSPSVVRRHTGGGEKHRGMHREGTGSGNSKQNFLPFVLVISNPGRIKGSLTLRVSSARLINMCKCHTQCERPSNGSPKLESLFSRRVMKHGVENIA